MKRVLINASTFKLSRPGVDVSNAAAADLIFDGFGQYAYNGVYVSGLFPNTSMVGSSSNYRGVVNFGKTFSAPPQCVVKLVDVNHPNARMGFYLGIDEQKAGAGPVQFSVTTTTLTVTIPYTGNVFPAQIGFSYVALQI